MYVVALLIVCGTNVKFLRYTLSNQLIRYKVLYSIVVLKVSSDTSLIFLITECFKKKCEIQLGHKTLFTSDSPSGSPRSNIIFFRASYETQSFPT